MKSQSRQYRCTQILLIIYVVLLSWVILFKMALSADELPRLQNINLIPFGDSAVVNGVIDVSEIISNVVAFIPLGVYLGMLRSDKSFWQRLLPIAGLSLVYEVLQYIFSLGATDITDLLGNTMGGAAGLLLYLVLSRIVKNHGFLVRLINGLAGLCTGLLLVLLALIIVVN